MQIPNPMFRARHTDTSNASSAPFNTTPHRRNLNMAIINGRRIDPSRIGNGVRGSDLTSHINAGPGRRTIIENQGKVEQVDPHRWYKPHELVDKNGRGAKVTSMPDRSKGYGFGGPRSQESYQIITEQVVDIAENLFKQGVAFDEDEAHWMVVPNYFLPPRWHSVARNTSLLVAFPNEYPRLPPIGFYMTADLPLSPDGHFFDWVAHGAWEAPISQGWKWYCTYIHDGAWQPARNWRNGDSLYTYFHLINEVLGN